MKLKQTGSFSNLGEDLLHVLENNDVVCDSILEKGASESLDVEPGGESQTDGLTLTEVEPAQGQGNLYSTPRFVQGYLSSVCSGDWVTQDKDKEQFQGLYSVQSDGQQQFQHPSQRGLGNFFRSVGRKLGPDSRISRSRHGRLPLRPRRPRRPHPRHSRRQVNGIVLTLILTMIPRYNVAAVDGTSEPSTVLYPILGP